jgi:histidinol-phosphatase
MKDAMPALDLGLAMTTARRAVEAAAAASLGHFRRGVLVEVKPDRTPVTAADRESEQAVFAVVREAFPDHGLLGEETGAHAGTAGTRWIVDPLDGTKGFTRGRSFWGPLVALEHEGAIVAGAMALPALGETYWAARGLGAWLSTGGAPPVRLRVSGIREWPDATLSFGEPHVLFRAPLLERVAALAIGAQCARCYGDVAGAALVLKGQAEAWVEAGVQIWDLGPFPVLAEEAGGRFTDLEGRPTIASGGCLLSNGLVHEHVLRVLRGG